MEALTPVDTFAGWWAKREDHAAATTPDMPCGAKMRQYLAMLAATPRPAVVLVGASGTSAMPVYVAAAAKLAGVPGVVYVAGRAEPTAGVRWAAAQGAEVVAVRPGYLSVVRARAATRRRAANAAGVAVVQWDVARAVLDTAAQCGNLPGRVARVVVPTGSGLTAAGVMVGLARMGWAGVVVVAYAVSDLADAARITKAALKAAPDLADALPVLEVVRCPGRYGSPCAAVLPNGDRLDEYYAARAMPVVVRGDCLWVTGLRPAAAV